MKIKTFISYFLSVLYSFALLHTVIPHDYCTDVSGTEQVVCVDEQQGHDADHHFLHCESQLHNANYIFKTSKQISLTILLSAVVSPVNFFDFAAPSCDVPKQNCVYLTPKIPLQFFTAVPLRAPPFC